MDIEDLLRQRRPSVLRRWAKMIVETYPAETARFLQDSGNRFANPVAHTISSTTEALYDGLCQRKSLDVVCEQLDPLIRIRAIQDFSPSEAVGFLFFLKKAIRHELKDEVEQYQMAAQLLSFESRIDELALLAFDLYMKCREQLYELRAAEVKRQARSLLKRAEQNRCRKNWQRNLKGGDRQ